MIKIKRIDFEKELKKSSIKGFCYIFGLTLETRIEKRIYYWIKFCLWCLISWILKIGIKTKDHKQKEETTEEWLDNVSSYYNKAYNEYLSNAKPLSNKEKEDIASGDLYIYECDIKTGRRKKTGEFEITNISFE